MRHRSGPGRRRHGPRRERGAATLVVVACAAMLVAVGCALGAASALVTGHRSAQAAADLAALAGAVAAGRGEDACGAAGEIATANGATLTGCLPSGRELTVEVVVRGPTLAGWHGDLVAHSRAGPA